jgi:hypothetical protein
VIYQEARGFSRQLLSSETRHVLTQIASGDLERSWPEVAQDWDEILDGVYRNGLLGLTERYLAHGLAGRLPPAEFRSTIERARTFMHLHMALMYCWIGKVTAQISAAGIEAIILKGPALATSVYPCTSLRAFGDLDLMVRERDMPAAHAALIDMGLVPERDLSRIPPKLTSGCTTYEAQYVDPTNHFVVEMHYDDLLNAGLASRDINGFWERAVPLDCHGTAVKILCPEDQLIHLCTHMHYHGYVKLIWFSDLAFLLRERADAIDWNQVIATTRAEEAQTPVYYSLLFLEQLLEISLPEGVLASLEPDRFRARLHEYFMPSSKVLSLEPMARPDFSFYFLPLGKRLLPDLLTMGRRREKIHCLLRLMAPATPWLRHYYGLSARQRTAGYRVSHPLRLLWYYVRELAAIPRTNGPWWNNER